jgi:hypothetical protein
VRQSLPTCAQNVLHVESANKDLQALCKATKSILKFIFERRSMTEINSSVVPWLGQGVPVSLEFQVHNDSHGAQLSCALHVSCKYKPAISLALVEE